MSWTGYKVLWRYTLQRTLMSVWSSCFGCEHCCTSNDLIKKRKKKKVSKKKTQLYTIANLKRSCTSLHHCFQWCHIEYRSCCFSKYFSGIQFWVNEQLTWNKNYTGECCPQHNGMFCFFSSCEHLLVFPMFCAVRCRMAWTCWTGLLSGGI